MALSLQMSSVSPVDLTTPVTVAFLLVCKQKPDLSQEHVYVPLKVAVR